MKIKALGLTKCFLGILFLAICLFGAIVPAQNIGNQPISNSLKKYQLSSTSQYMPDGPLLKLTSIENDTENCEFKVFYGSDVSCAFIFPQTIFNFSPHRYLVLNSENMLVLKCSRGSFYPVFVKHCGIASGQAPEGYEGPYCISMWLSHPQVPETSKVYVRYVVKKETEGHIGIKIGKKGDYRFVAHQNVHFLV